MARYQAVAAKHDLTNLKLHLEFYDEEGNPKTEVSYAPKELPEEMQNTALLFGIQQAIVQRNTGKTADERKKQADEIWQSLKNGNWGRKRASAGGGPVPLVVRAIARVMKISETQAHKAYRNYPEDKRKAFAENERVKKEIEKLQKEAEAQKDVSLDDLIES